MCPKQINQSIYINIFLFLFTDSACRDQHEIVWKQQLIFYIINHNQLQQKEQQAEMLNKMIKLTKYSISNIQTHIDLRRVIEHKKYQMMNQIDFHKACKKQGQARPKLQKNEIETRILKLLYESDLVDLNEFRFEDDIRKQYYLDSLDVTDLVSSIQEEFNTIFDPQTYEKARSLSVIVEALMNDETIV